MKTLDEFKEEAKKHQNPEGKTFTITCDKCNSSNVIIEMNYDFEEGSEYTGIYNEEVGALLKCKSCGNAFAIIKTLL